MGGSNSIIIKVRVCLDQEFGSTRAEEERRGMERSRGSAKETIANIEAQKEVERREEG